MPEILCSGCDRDITKTHNAGMRRLVLKAELIPEWEDQWAIECLQREMISRDHYFCSLLCLYKWADEQLPSQYILER